MVEQFNEFEFERRFFCLEFPESYDVGLPPSLIIQNYYLADDGYAIRIRIQSSSIKVKMSSATDAREIIDNYADLFDIAIMTVKGPSIGGTRYEVETILDPLVAIELIKRGGKTIVKNRFSAFIGKDGWVIDIFGNDNHDLIVAECERMSPVIDLEIPAFCLLEVTHDKKFSNDSLVNQPYSAFKQDFLAELSKRQDGTQDSLYSSQFGTNTLLVDSAV